MNQQTNAQMTQQSGSKFETWKFPHFQLYPRDQPASRIPEYLGERSVRRVLNLRGRRVPKYSVPPHIAYTSLFIKGGPNGNVSFDCLKDAVRYIADTPENSVCIVHCEHGQNRTGLVACAAAMALAKVSYSEAVQQFASLRPPGIQRKWVHRILRCWEKHCQKYPQLYRNHV